MNYDYVNEESQSYIVGEDGIQFNENEEYKNDNLLNEEKEKENYYNLDSIDNQFPNGQNDSDTKDKIYSKPNSVEPIYVMTLELDENKSTNIKIYSDSVPYELAYEFCKENNLDYKSLSYLAGEIENLMTHYKKKLTNNFNKYVTNPNEEIIELEEEQITTDKNRNSEERERENLNSLNLDYGIERKENLNLNDKIPFQAQDSKGLKFSQTGETKIFFENKEENFSERALDDMEINEIIDKDNNYIYDNKNSNQENNLDENNENPQNNNEIEEAEDVVGEVSNIVYENLDELNKSNREIVEKYEEDRDIGLSTPEPEKLEAHETPQIQNQNSLKNSRRSSNRANQPEEKNVTNNYHSQTEFNQNNINNNNQQFDQVKNLITIPNNNPQYPSVMFSYPSKTNLNYPKTNYISIRSNSVNKIMSKKQNIFERLFKEAQLKRILPKHGRSYKAYYTELEKNDKSNHLNTNQGQLIYYKEKVLKEEKFRKLSKNKIEYMNTIEGNYNTTNSKSKPNIFSSKTPIHASKSYLNSLSDFNTDDLNKTIHKKHVSSQNFFCQNKKDYPDNTISNPSHRDYKTENENEYVKKRNHSFNLNTNMDSRNYHNHNSNFTKTKFIPYKNLFENEEKQKFKKILKIQKLRNQTENNFTFKPIVDNKYKCDLNFLERQEIYRENSKNRKNEIDKILKNPTDEKGTPLFQPTIIADHRHNNFLTRDNSFKNVFDKNYEYANKYQLNRENLKKRFDSENEKILIQNGDSEEIFEKLKEEAFKNLFRELDNDEDDLITPINIGLNYLPSEIRNIIDPILIELKEENETLNEKEFVKAMSLLFEMLNYNDRQILIKKYKNTHMTARGKKNENEKYSFGFKVKLKKLKKIANYKQKF